MKRFLYKITIFFLIPFLYFLVNMTINYFVYATQSLPINKASVLIVGDSHPRRSLNPIYFHDAQNISQPAEPYVLTFWKLKCVFKTYIPDTLIIGVAPHNISQFNDLKFSHSRWASEMFRRSYPIHNYTNISHEIPVDYLTFAEVLWKQTALFPKKNHINFIGNYSNKKSSDVSDAYKVIKRHYYDNKKKLGVSELSVNYLDSIVRLCDSKGIQLILVSHPVHKTYLNNIPDEIIKKHNELTEKYDLNHIVYNKTKDNYPDSLFLNSDHMNEYGAKKFSMELIKFLNNKERIDDKVHNSTLNH